MSAGTPLTRELRVLLTVFAGLALAAGFLLFPLAEKTEDYFAWTIQPPLTAAFMGAAYWAAFVLIGWTARTATWEAAVPTLVPVTTIAVLLLATTLIHLDKFDLDSLFGWFWLIVYCTVPPLLFLLVWRQQRIARSPQGEGGQRGSPAKPPSDPPRPEGAIPALLRGLLAVQALVMATIGIVMFVEPSTADDLWPWTLTPLTARAVSSFLIGFAAAGAYAVVDNRLPQFAGAAYSYAALGALELLAAAIFSADFDDGARTVLYLVFMVSVLAAGAAGSLAVRGAQRR